MDPQTSKFVISLDFELYWGIFDKASLDEYGANIKGVREAIPLILETFKEFGLHATWATVGMLTFDDKTMLLHALPKKEPSYSNPGISSYRHLREGGVGNDEKCDPYHFAPSLIRLIKSFPFQEIGSHTFSHYFCLEAGQTADDFRADLEASREALSRFDVSLRSFVFPKSQSNPAYLPLLKDTGIVAYRGTEKHFLYEPRQESRQSLSIRARRLMDHYFNLSGMHTYPLPKADNGLVNVASSRFLRPYNKFLAPFEPIRFRRIRDAMHHAAEENEVFHLWWHPHNFGVECQRNIGMLRKIAQEYCKLNRRFGMESATIGEIADLSLRTHIAT